MKREETMKNLWMDFVPARASRFMHTGDMVSSTFTPIWKAGQRIDPSRHSGVIPLRGASY
jgi:hypothetical protein